MTRAAWRAFILAGLSVSNLLGPADPAQIERVFREGERALAEKRYEEAAKAYEQLLKLDAGSAEARARLGMIYFQQGQFERAIPALRHALKLKPSLSNADVLLAASLCELGKYSEALPGLERGFHKGGDPALRRLAGLQLLRAHTGLQQDRKAVDVALEMSQLYSKDPEVLYHAGKIFGNYAYLTMRTLSDLAPESEWTIQAIAESQESQGAYDQAILRYRRLVALAPRRPGIHYRLGRALLQQSEKNGDEAVREFKQELEIDPTNANASYELGVIHYRQAQYDKAEAAFKLALHYYPDFQEAEVGLGRALIALRKPSSAVDHLQRAVLLNANDEVAWYTLSRAYRDLGNTAAQQKALAEFQRLRNARSQQEAVRLERAVTKQDVDPETKD